MLNTMQIGKRVFPLQNRTYIMGILNVTPDSFSDGGKFNAVDQALFHVEEMIKQGCDIVDIGGESTRPGYTVVPIQEEIERVAPVIEAIKNRLDVPVSLDTYKYQVAEAGIAAGADLINDIWGLKYDDKMAKIISENKVACCLMHNRKDAIYESFLEDVVLDLQDSINMALTSGIEIEKLMIDPGVGFGKTYEQNLEILRKIDALHALVYPILLGVSRKSVIGLTLDLPIEERLNGTLALSAYGMLQGCSFIRVHDIKQNKEIVRMLEAVKGTGF